MTAAAASGSAEGTFGQGAAARTLPKRGSSLTPLWALYLLTLRQFLHGKRPFVMVLLFILPAALVLLVRSTATETNTGILEFSFIFMFIPQAMLPLVALVYALGILQDEQEGQTLTYLLIRPIPKWALYGVKLLATVTMAILLTAAFTALAYVAIYFGRGDAGHEIIHRCLTAIGIHALSVVAYCCLFGLISLLTKWTLVSCVLYTAVIELLLANLPFSIRLMTVIYYARVIAYRTLSFVTTVGFQTTDLAADAWQLGTKEDPRLLEHPQVATCLIVLIGGSLVCALLGAVICSRREFYVKTPEQL